MGARLTKAVLTISVELGSAAQLEQRRQRDDASQRLLAALVEHRLPASWSVDDPVALPFERPPHHDVALAVDPAATGDDGQLGKALSRQLQLAAAAGMPISTLAVNDAAILSQLDLAARLGVTAVLHPANRAPSRSRHLHLPRPRFGLWGFTVSCELPGRSRWLPGGGSGSVKRTLEQVIEAKSVAHLAIDISRLLARGHSSQRIALRTLAAIDRHRHTGRLEVATLSSLAARLSGQQTGRPSRSILRSAA